MTIQMVKKQVCIDQINSEANPFFLINPVLF